MTQDQTAGSAVRTGFLASIPWRVKWFVFLVFFTATGYGYFQVLVSAYLPQIGFSSGSVGLILGVNGIAVVLASVPLGLYADRKGKRPILFVGLVVFPFTLLAFAVLRNLAAFLVAGAVAGLVEGAFLSTWNALIADMTTPQNRNHAFSLSFIVASFAFGLGYAIPFVFPFLGATFNLGLVQVHQYATIAISAFAFVSPAGMLVVMKGYAEPERKAPGSARGSLRPLLKFSGLNSLIGLGAGFIIPLIATWFYLRFAIPDTYSGPLLAISNMTIAIAAVGSPFLAKKFGSVRAIVLAQGSSMVFMLSMIVAPNAAIAGVIYVVRSALMNMSSPLSDSYLMGIIPAEQRSLASAVNSIFWRLPNSLTTIAGGMILAMGDYQLPFYLATVLYVFGISGFFLVFRNVKPTA